MGANLGQQRPHAQPFFARHWQKLAALLIWLLLVGAFLLYVRATGRGVGGAGLRLVDLIQSTIFGPLIYIGLYALRPVTLFSAVVLTIVGGFLFGPVSGVFYTVIGANASALVAYGIGRYLGDGLIDLERSGELVQRYAQRMQKNSFETVLIMRFLFLPYDLVGMVAGFLRIDWRAFLLATASGSILGTISFVLLGASATRTAIDSLFLTGEIPSLDWRVLAASVGVFVISLAVSRAIRRRERSVGRSI